MADATLRGEGSGGKSSSNITVKDLKQLFRRTRETRTTAAGQTISIPKTDAITNTNSLPAHPSRVSLKELPVVPGKFFPKRIGETNATPAKPEVKRVLLPVLPRVATEPIVITEEPPKKKGVQEVAIPFRRKSSLEVTPERHQQTINLTAIQEETAPQQQERIPKRKLVEVDEPVEDEHQKRAKRMSITLDNEPDPQEGTRRSSRTRRAPKKFDL